MRGVTYLYCHQRSVSTLGLKSTSREPISRTHRFEGQQGTNENAAPCFLRMAKLMEGDSTEVEEPQHEESSGGSRAKI